MLRTSRTPSPPMAEISRRVTPGAASGEPSVMTTRTNVLRSAPIAGVALIVAAPILATLAGAITAPLSIGEMSPATPDYARGTIYLCLLVGLGAGVIGAGAGFIVGLADFPGRRVVAVLLALPFAIPAYIAAYAYGDLLSPFGAVARLAPPGALPEIRSLPGAAFVLTLSTYPYVYLAVLAALAKRSGAYLEAARALGASPIAAARRALIPVTRPALAGGLALALMETAADYGVADYFGVRTLSVGIFRTWYGLGDLAGATQIAAALFFVALILTGVEESARRGETADSARAPRAQSRIRLSARASALALLLLSIPIIFGFAAPALVLAAKFDPAFSDSAARGLSGSFANTAIVAGAGALGAMALAVWLAGAARGARMRGSKILIRVATMGYAIPGAVIAIGILAIVAFLSRTLGLGAAGGVGVLLYAYIARFLTAGYNSAAGGYQQVSPQMDQAARSLGAGPLRLLTAVHWPMIRTPLFAGAAIVGIDIAKELPATLLLRPFNFETLATRIYRLASDERLAEAAPAALLLIAVSLPPTVALALAATRRQR